MSFTLRLLHIQFEGELAPHEVPAFRGAVAAKAGHEHVLFHNHEGERLRYGYPLIQYKSHRRRPALLCLGEGVDEIHHFFSQPDWTLTLSGRQLSMRIERMELQSLPLAVSPELSAYHLRRWVGLNQRSWPEYRALPDPSAQRAYLQKKLLGNLLSFAKGVGWYIPEQLQVEITQLTGPQPVRFKGVHLATFDLAFRANLKLPPELGLGGKVSFGFGCLSLQ